MTPSTSRLILPFAAALLAACGTREQRQTAALPPPAAEFLVATQDSTFWVRTDPRGVRVRGAPLTLAKYDDRFYEIFIADDDRSYDDALLEGLRLYRRDLITGDSAIVFEDTIVPRLAREYARNHPGAHPLAPDEDGADDPPLQALADIEVVGLHGPYLSYEYHVDITNRGADPWHATRRGVIDLRSGRSLRLTDLLPASAASAVIDSGKRELTAVLDSARAASSNPKSSRTGGAHSFTAFRFDERSFVLTVPDSQLAVEFDVPQRGIDAPDEVFTLDALRVPPPTWWPGISADFPIAGDDLDRWQRFASTGYDLIARYDSSAETARLSISDQKHEWPVQIVAAPILHVFWLDKPAVDSAQRQALGRAFNEASLYDESARTVREVRRRFGPRSRLVVARWPRAHAEARHHT
jgi:hypothetical protein